jgi:hypothetical protein
MAEVNVKFANEYDENGQPVFIIEKKIHLIDVNYNRLQVRVDFVELD